MGRERWGHITCTCDEMALLSMTKTRGEREYPDWILVEKERGRERDERERGRETLKEKVEGKI